LPCVETPFVSWIVWVEYFSKPLKTELLMVSLALTLVEC